MGHLKYLPQLSYSVIALVYNGMRQKGADAMANVVDPDQTAPFDEPDLDLHCLLRLIVISDEYNGWAKTSEGGDGFIVETEPAGCNDLKDFNEEAEGKIQGH